MKKFALLLCVLVMVALSLDNRSEAAPPVRDAPATTTITDFDPVYGTPFSIGSDSLGSYNNGVNSVSSIVQGIGNWVLDTKPSTVRKVYLDFRDPVIGGGGAAPFQWAHVPVRFISKCTTNITTMALNQTIQCPLALSIVYNNVTYALRTNENYGGTEPVNWTCLARNSTKCISWEMTPSAVQADGQRKNVMQLLKPAVSKREPEQLLGLYYMSFKINVTTP
jgi:hypothetical protein